MTTPNLRHRDFEDEWRFFLGDDSRAARPEYDDSAWRIVDLPHDWSVEGEFDASHTGATASLPTGVGWYRKSFTALASADKKHYVHFDGVYMNSDVWINGRYLGRRPYGYSAFEYDITPFLAKDSAANVIAVRVDNSKQPNSRWYSGSGIFRHVWLIERNVLHIDPWGCSIATASLSEGAALATVDVAIRVMVARFAETIRVGQKSETQDETSSCSCTLTTVIEDAAGRIVAEKSRRFAMLEHSATTISEQFAVANPNLWSPSNPYLYRVRTTLRDGVSVVDEQTFPLGIRTAVFDADQGFVLNGVKTHLKGVCLHHDAGCIGAAVPERTWRRRLRLLKDMGCNALRLSHCPFPAEVYDFCDEMGFLVMDEAFDEWTEGYTPGLVEGTWGKCEAGYHLYFDQWSETDLRTMIRRDRRHPSIVIYSVGNEIPEQGRPSALPKLKRLIEITREEDPTRPVTMGCDFAWEANQVGLMDMLDVAGYNYVHRKYPDYYVSIHRDHPQRKLLGTETHQYFDYWRAVKDNPAVAGEFIWAGHDYLGEAAWPRIQSVSSPIDLCSYPKPHYYYYRAIWSGAPSVYLAVERPGASPHVDWTLPDVHAHWNWEGVEALKVVCYSNCEEIHIELNGRTLGVSRANPDGSPIHTLQAPFEPGCLKAIGKIGGRVVAEHELRTAGAPARIRLTADTLVMTADGNDVAHVDVAIEDENGLRVPDAAVSVTAEVTGSAALFAMAAPDPSNHTCFRSSTHATYRGRALVVLRSLAGETGAVELIVSAPGLPSSTLSLAASSSTSSTTPK
ncbi:MAG: glycoside hydrolase family 2 TIM barrel-domain containing protein [Capsulimonadaceae bacterium]|nr:glycoside hydrolase family 2 TIM barrel-domain containing protein [Capsulimonadaceae bacterium]